MLAREKMPSSIGRSTPVFSIPIATRDRRRAAASRSFLRTRFLCANALSLSAAANDTRGKRRGYPRLMPAKIQSSMSDERT